MRLAASESPLREVSKTCDYIIAYGIAHEPKEDPNEISVESLESDQQQKASADPKSVKGVVMASLLLMKEAMKAFVVRRPGYRRAYILILVFTYAIMVSLFTGSQQVFGTYAFRRPLRWSASTLSYWSSAMSLTGMFGNFIGAVLFKKVFHFRVSQCVLYT